MRNTDHTARGLIPPQQRPHTGHTTLRRLWQRLHLDMGLLCCIALLLGFGFVMLYSADDAHMALVQKQSVRLSIGLGSLLVLAQIPPQRYRQWAPWLFVLSVLMLVLVSLMGHIGKGAQRWLHLGIFTFEPSEILKLTLPLVLAWFLHQHPLPVRGRTLLICSGIIAFPTLLVAMQPDLGTAILLACTSLAVLILAGMRWRIVGFGVLVLAAALPILWHHMHSYQRQRVLTFLNPEADPLGSGYHIIQSKIAIGSGGLWGKGWLLGTQSHLNFLPEHATDFIFAVCGEEFGLIGSLLLIVLILALTYRMLIMASCAQDTFSRLLAGALAANFFVATFVNIGMVSGLLPVVGVPFPLVSYGGTTLVTELASFGIIMSIHTHRKLIAS